MKSRLVALKYPVILCQNIHLALGIEEELQEAIAKRVTELPGCLIHFVRLRHIFGERFQMTSSLIVGQNPKEFVVRAQDLIGGFIQMRKAEEHSGNDLERSLLKHTSEVVDNLLLPIRTTRDFSPLFRGVI